MSRSTPPLPNNPSILTLSLSLGRSTDRRFQSREISQNRLTGLADDETSLGWDYSSDFNPERSGWAERVKSTIPRIEEDEIYFLKKLDKEVSGIVPEQRSTAHGSAE